MEQGQILIGLLPTDPGCLGTHSDDICIFIEEDLNFIIVHCTPFSLYPIRILRVRRNEQINYSRWRLFSVYAGSRHWIYHGQGNHQR